MTTNLTSKRGRPPHSDQRATQDCILDAALEALMREAGPDLLGTVAGGVELDQFSAQAAIPEMVGSIVEAWTAPGARAFTSLILRMGPDGIGNSLKEMSARLRPVFDAWQVRGELRADITVDVAIWQVFGPLSALRLANQNGSSTAGCHRSSRDRFARSSSPVCSLSYSGF
jgi:hypothetical protein